MCKRCKPTGSRRIDKCMNILCYVIRASYQGRVRILGSCCGHGKYPPSIVVQSTRGIFEFISDIDIPRKRKFYKLDRAGVYYIPEVLGEK